MVCAAKFGGADALEVSHLGKIRSPESASSWRLLSKCSALCHAEYERPLGRTDANYVIHASVVCTTRGGKHSDREVA
jgi:hypothetical protein